MGVKITIYLNDGLPRGIREAKIDQWSGKAICSPRSRLKDIISDIAELRHGACVYFLVGLSEEGGLPKVYVGEADGFQQRIRDHDQKKEWWQEVVIFYSPDQSLTKASVKYLESIIAERLKKAGKCIVENANKPTLPSVPKEDVSGLEHFYRNLILVMPLLGYDIFIQEGEESRRGLELFIASNKEGVRVSGIFLKDGKIEVLKDSVVATSEAASFKDYAYKKLKDQLIGLGKIRLKSGKLTLVENYIFDSPSAAASVILGRPASGPIEWKTKDGKTLRIILDNQLK